jgi:hypothetical protein
MRQNWTIHGPQLGRLLVVRQRRMTDADWVSVAEYADVPSAQVVSRRLTMDGIQNRIVSNFSGPAYNQNGACSIWVPPQSAADAKRLLQDPPISEDELAALALKYPRPDDA